MPDMSQEEYNKTMNSLRNSNLDDSTKYDAMYEVEKEYNRQQWIKKHNADLERQLNSRGPTTPPTGGCCIITLMCAVTGLGGVAIAGSTLSAKQDHQSETILSGKASQQSEAQITPQKEQKAILISRKDIIKNNQMNLENEHVKN